MGMTDMQFASYVRQLIDRIEDILEETDDSRKEKKLRKILESLQKSIEK